MVGKQGLEPRLPDPRSGALTLTQHPAGWTTGDSNSAPPVCKTGALPDELAAHSSGSTGRRLSDYRDEPDVLRGLWLGRADVSHSEVVNKRARSPLTGGASQGQRASNPQPPVLETGALPVELCPYEKTALRESGGGAFVVCVSASYVGTLAPILRSLSCEQTSAIGRYCSMLRDQVNKLSAFLVVVLRCF
jgi:hypothetical protein